MNIGLRNPTCAMRSRNYMQSTIGLIANIKMKPDRNHPLQNLRRWLNVKNASLCGPRPKSRNIFPCAHRNCDFLMPGNPPIRLWDFVEEDSTNGECLLSEHCL